jgi:hypothetical protein
MERIVPKFKQLIEKPELYLEKEKKEAKSPGSYVDGEMPLSSPTHRQLYIMLQN